MKGGYSCTINNNIYEGFEKDYEINRGEQYFQIEEIEIFQLFFEL